MASEPDQEVFAAEVYDLPGGPHGDQAPDSTPYLHWCRRGHRVVNYGEVGNDLSACPVCSLLDEVRRLRASVEIIEQRGYERGRAEERAEILAMVRTAIREGVKPDLLDPAIQAVARTAPNGVRAYAASTLAVLAEDIHERGEHAGEVEASDE